MKDLRFHIGVASDVGNTKKVNQDSVLVETSEHGDKKVGLFVVCDGLGGLSKGEVASITTVKYFKEWWNKNFREVVNYGDEEILNSLESTIFLANDAIYKYSQEVDGNIGTTVTALFICGSKYYIVNVGDSRIYKINKEVVQETEDDSYIAMKVKSNEMSLKQAQNSKMKNVLLQCVGAKENLVVYKKNGDIEDANAFIICSDGFYNKFTKKEMKACVSKLLKSKDYDIDVKESAVNMIDRVKLRRETDNISVIVVLIEKEQEKIRFFDRLFDH